MLPKFLAVALAASLVSAQTHSECDPTKKDGCPNPKAVGSQIVDIDFRKGANKFFKLADGTSLKYDKNLGAVFSIASDTQAPTIHANPYIFFGQVDVTVRAARGKGIVTSVVLQSDDLDEIDWEWLGGDATQVQTNYFSKGCTETYDRGGFSPVADPINQFHTYTIKWTPEQLDWIIDGAVVRTLKNTGVEGCSGYPQSPMQLRVGTWVAGREGAPQGTIDWAGGIADFADGPFDGYYQTIRVQDFMGGQGATEATEYVYTDRSGKWQSIKVVNDGKDVETSSTSTSKATTKTTTKASSTATTLTTVSSSATTTESDAETTTTASSTHGNNATTTSGPSTTDGSDSETSPTPEPSTGAAAKLVGNFAAMGVAAILGYLVL